jgi:putative FmdB family regulatory protein
MPTYDYKCRGCDHQFEELQSFSEPPLTKCPSCKKNKLARLFGGGGAIIFKGSGFYETDYRKDSYKKAAEADAAPTANGKAEAKSESAPASTESTSTPAESKAPAAKKPGKKK